MSLVRLPVNSRLLAVKFWESQKVYVDFQLHAGSVLPTPALFQVSCWMLWGGTTSQEPRDPSVDSGKPGPVKYGIYFLMSTPWGWVFVCVNYCCILRVYTENRYMIEANNYLSNYQMTVISFTILGGLSDGIWYHGSFHGSTWLNHRGPSVLIKHFSGCVCISGFNSWISSLNKADCCPRCGWASSNWLEA